MHFVIFLGYKTLEKKKENSLVVLALSNSANLWWRRTFCHVSAQRKVADKNVLVHITHINLVTLFKNLCNRGFIIYLGGGGGRGGA